MLVPGPYKFARRFILVCFVALIPNIIPDLGPRHGRVRHGEAPLLDAPSQHRRPALPLIFLIFLVFLIFVVSVIFVVFLEIVGIFGTQEIEPHGE